MFSSVRAGARALLRKLPDLEGALVCLVDMPLVEAETYARVVQRVPARPRRRRDRRATRARRGTRSCCRARSSSGSATSRSPRPPRTTLADFIEAHAERRRFVDAQDPAVLININTPDAYRTHLGEDPDDRSRPRA